MSSVRVRKNRLRWIPRIIILVIILPLGLLAIGFIYETIASKSDWDRYPPPGEFIDIGGYKLHLYCTGQRASNQPIVVLEAGSGSASPDWALVQPEIAKFTRVCSYDRAGLGWSNPGPLPRNSEQYATELHTLLTSAGEKPPYLFVGHSLGGHTVRIYTQAHPEDVVGMVLVDTRPTSGQIPTGPIGTGQLKMWEFLAHCGFFRLIGKGALQTQAPSLAEKIPDYPYPIVIDAAFFETDRLQEMTIQESDKRAQETGPFGDLPLAVISHEIPSLFSFLPPDEIKEAEDLWQAEQRDFANLSTNSQYLIAEGSGHNIQLDNPDIIIDTVLRMLDAYR
jgi:pimeloyl-ACP methyl ester carboxylesterase